MRPRFAYESCIQGAIIARGDALKSTLVVDTDTIDTVAFSLAVLIKCRICSFPRSLTRTPLVWLKKTNHDKIVIFHPHGGVTLVDGVFLVVVRLLLWRRLVDKRGDLDDCLDTCSCRVCLVSAWKDAGRGVETAAVATVIFFEEEHEKHWFASVWSLL